MSVIQPRSSGSSERPALSRDEAGQAALAQASSSDGSGAESADALGNAQQRSPGPTGSTWRDLLIARFASAGSRPLFATVIAVQPDTVSGRQLAQLQLSDGLRFTALATQSLILGSTVQVQADRDVVVRGSDQPFPVRIVGGSDATELQVQPQRLLALGLPLTPAAVAVVAAFIREGADLDPVLLNRALSASTREPATSTAASAASSSASEASKHAANTVAILDGPAHEGGPGALVRSLLGSSSLAPIQPSPTQPSPTQPSVRSQSAIQPSQVPSVPQPPNAMPSECMSSVTPLPARGKEVALFQPRAQQKNSGLDKATRPEFKTNANLIAAQPAELQARQLSGRAEPTSIAVQHLHDPALTAALRIAYAQRPAIWPESVKLIPVASAATVSVLVANQSPNPESAPITDKGQPLLDPVGAKRPDIAAIYAATASALGPSAESSTSPSLQPTTTQTAALRSAYAASAPPASIHLGDAEMRLATAMNRVQSTAVAGLVTDHVAKPDPTSAARGMAAPAVHNASAADVGSTAESASSLPSSLPSDLGLPIISAYARLAALRLPTTPTLVRWAVSANHNSIPSALNLTPIAAEQLIATGFSGDSAAGASLQNHALTITPSRFAHAQKSTPAGSPATAAASNAESTALSAVAVELMVNRTESSARGSAAVMLRQALAGALIEALQAQLNNAEVKPAAASTAADASAQLRERSPEHVLADQALRQAGIRPRGEPAAASDAPRLIINHALHSGDAEPARAAFADSLLPGPELNDYERMLAIPLHMHGELIPARIAIGGDEPDQRSRGSTAQWLRLDTELSQLGAISLRMSDSGGGPLAITIVAAPAAAAVIAHGLSELIQDFHALNLSAAVRVMAAEAQT